MKIADLPIPSQAKSIFIDEDGITELYPPQADAIKNGVLDYQNLLLAIPTAAGKTLIAELAAVKHILERKGKVIYLAPLRALASEKYEDFKRFEKLGMKIVLTSGEFDSDDHFLVNYDIIISTNEKLDALLRHSATLLQSITLFVIDEFHLINEAKRGPVLEILLTKINVLRPEAQILALSATVNNATEMGLWLNAKPIVSTWRPVPLQEGICRDNLVTYLSGHKRRLGYNFNDPIVSLAVEMLIEGGQVLIFANSRKNAINLCKRLKTQISSYLDQPTQDGLQLISDQILKIDTTDNITRELASYIQNGVAFHHAGLSTAQRHIIEAGFKHNLIKVITATPTLSAGINLPARMVIISSPDRYSLESGHTMISVAEYEQMRGRAGRPKYDTRGEAILIASTKQQEEFYMDRYLHGETEKITSKLMAEPAIRSLILGLVATQEPLATTIEGIADFLQKTLYGHQFESSLPLIEAKVEKIVEFMIENMFFSKDELENTLKATELGMRISQLYLDPLSAKILKDGINQATTMEGITDFAILHLICSTPDMTRLFVRKTERKGIEKILATYADQLLIEDLPEPYSVSYDKLLVELKAASLLEQWIEEADISVIAADFDIGQGDLARIGEVAKWQLYSLREITRLFAQQQPALDQLYQIIQVVEFRIEYGVRSELVPLCQLKGIGRVKARELYSKGLTTLESIQQSSDDELLKIKGIGNEVLAQIRNDLPQKISEAKFNLPPTIKKARRENAKEKADKALKKPDQGLMKYFNPENS